MTGHCYWGGVIGSVLYDQSYLEQKVDEWLGDLKNLSLIVQSQPNACYAAYIFTVMVCLLVGTIFLYFLLFSNSFPTTCTFH